MNTNTDSQSGMSGLSRRSRLLESGLGLGALALLAAFVWASLWNTDSVARPKPQAKSVATSSTSKIAQQRIADLRVGDRVLGENPEVSNAERATFADPDPATWRKFTLRLAKPDGHSVDIELLRPLDDDDFADAQPGESIYLDLHELGAEGDAEVLAVSPCPVIRAGAGNVVTGTFQHSATNLIDLRLEGESQPIGCTANHPFWSVDREEFIPAGDLQTGEKVLSRTGAPTAVIAAVVRPGLLPVYNLEVNGEHVYHVGSVGLLVHNSCLLNSNMTTLKLSNSAWRQSKFSQDGLVYILKDSATGELLKVGQTTAKTFIGRFEKYVTAANRHNRELVIDVFEVPLAIRGKIEGQIRNTLTTMSPLHWDNAGQRLLRPGPGIP